jgi:hypothetical protein
MGGAVQSIPSQVEKNAEEPKLKAALVTHLLAKKREKWGPRIKPKSSVRNAGATAAL